MDYEDVMLDNETEDAEDSLPEGVIEEPDEESDEELDSIINENGDEDEGESDEEQPEGPKAKEPGYVQKRISKAVDKAVSETEARFRAQIEAMEAKYAPMMERMLDMEAQDLVRSGKIKDLETAKEFVRLRQGQGLPADQNKTEQPRQQNGQYAPKEDPATQARIDMLKHQADRIKESGGPDVIAEFNKNEKIKNKVVSGEMDFYDVANYLKDQKSSRKKPPAPMRAPNGSNGQMRGTIMSMSDKQFAELERRVKEGGRFRVK
jgi:hypothetical protein